MRQHWDNHSPEISSVVENKEKNGRKTEMTLSIFISFLMLKKGALRVFHGQMTALKNPDFINRLFLLDRKDDVVDY